MSAHDPQPKLAAIDLNLLVALDALLEAQNVTAAGKAIGASQPAMSHTLSRLRTPFRDESRVRRGRAMQPTELGKQLAPKVRSILGEIEATLFARQHFEPTSSQRTFRVAANDYCGAVLLPRVIERVVGMAPRVQVDIHAPPEQPPLGDLARGDLDLALGTYRRIQPPLRRKELFREQFVCLLRRNHPLEGPLTLKRYVELDHVLVANPGYGVGTVDYALAARNLRRRVVVKVPHFLVAPQIIARTNLVLTLPRRLADSVTGTKLRMVQPPLELDGFPVDLVWHQRGEADPGAGWLREQIRHAASQL